MANCYDTLAKVTKESYCMADLVNNSKTSKSFQISNRTLRLISNGGGFHLPEKNDADNIIAYETLFRNYHDFEMTVFQEAPDNVRNTLNVAADSELTWNFNEHPVHQGILPTLS